MKYFFTLIVLAASLTGCKKNDVRIALNCTTTTNFANTKEISGFLKHFKLTAGVRYDYSTAYNEVFTPRVGMVFNKNKFTSKLLYAEAFRAPKPWDYTDGEGNPDLQPDKLRSFEVYSEYYLTNKLKAEISIYNNYLFNALKKVDTENSHKW